MLSLLGNLFGAVMEGLGLVRQRDAAKNTPALKANAAAKTDAQIADTVAAAEQKAEQGNITDIQNLAGE